MPTIPQEIDCPECDEGRIEYGSGDSNGHTENCDTCHGRGRATVIPCPLHGMDGYTTARASPNGVALCCMICHAAPNADWNFDEICNVNIRLTEECTVPAELIALAESSARGEDYDYDRFNVLYQEVR